MSKRLQSAAVSGHLLYGGNGHLANECPASGPCSYCNTVTQPDVTVTDNGVCAGGDGLNGTYVWDHYELFGASTCRWWFFLDKDISGHVQNYWLKVIHGDAEARDKWAVVIERDVDFADMIEYAGTGDIECDGSGVIDHKTAAPLTLADTSGICAVGSEAYVTFNP